MGKEKELRGIALTLNRMNAQERSAYFKERRDRALEKKRIEAEEMHHAKLEISQKLIDLAQQFSFHFGDMSRNIPVPIIWEAHKALSRGINTTELRDILVTKGVITPETWPRLSNALYDEVFSRTQDLTADLFVSQNYVCEKIRRQINDLEHMKKRKPDDPRIHSEIVAAAKILHDVGASMMNKLKELGVIGEKHSKNNNVIHIHTQIPRPSLADVKQVLEVIPVLPLEKINGSS